MVAYSVVALDPLSLTRDADIRDMDLMSPFVWRDGEWLRMLLRAVPRPLLADGPTGLIVAATGSDGLSFAIDGRVAIGPRSCDADAGGCEDPTVLSTGDGQLLVYYTGVDAARAQGALLLAAGPDLHHLQRQPVTLKAPPGEGNIKEATLAQTPAGDWRLFYEYARCDASRIGMASGPTATGPWTILPDPFDVRADGWDNWHLSTGPVVQQPGRDPVMFYNGATQDARWRIGWISFDPLFERVTGRGLEPVVVPPPPQDRSATDIAFAASTLIDGDRIQLYYSLEDRLLRRATIVVHD